MILKTIIGNVKDIENNETIEWIELDWEELTKRILRKTTNKGREVAITFENEDHHLHVGDIVYKDDNVMIAIRTKLEPAYVVKPETIEEMGKISWEIGNRHTPAVYENNEIILRYDETLVPLFKKVGVQFEKTERRFSQPIKYNGHHH
ncbi:urease accessory protein UreE [Alkalihalobacterium elongatum]|uniref:urease accessory protein UreE n=1 Tax=Alkalihalobacterium elongatum TaxID=2675466 RepID=UPI001C1F7C44|nr:urease accessory protein UreE [Alkalihalobacterium elongatum]